MTLNCSQCPDYHGGQGVKSCLSCPEMRFIRGQRQGLLGSECCVRMDKDHLENLFDPSLESTRNIFDTLPLVDERCATILLQSTLLKMKNTEIALYHSISPTHVARLIQRGLREVRARF